MIKYLTILQVSFRNRNAYLAEVAGRSLFLVVILFIFFQLWNKVYGAAGTNTVAGFTRGDMLWYLVITETLTLSWPRQEVTINEEIRSGAIAYHLNKPYDYITYQLASFWGDLLARASIGAVLGGLAAWGFIGGVYLDLLHLPLSLIPLLGANLLHFYIMMTISLLAFVMEDSLPLFWIYHKLLFTIGGMLIPVTIFPDYLQRIGHWLPFGYILFGPAALAVHFEWPRFLQVLGGQLTWILVFMGVARWLYRSLVRRLDIQGG